MAARVAALGTGREDARHGTRPGRCDPGASRRSRRGGCAADRGLVSEGRRVDRDTGEVVEVDPLREHLEEMAKFFRLDEGIEKRSIGASTLSTP